MLCFIRILLLHDELAAKPHDHSDYLLVFFLFLFWLFSTVNKDGFKPNLETHLIPLLSTKIEETLESKEKSTASSLKPAHHPLLMQVSHSVFSTVSKLMNVYQFFDVDWELSIFYVKVK